MQGYTLTGWPARVLGHAAAMPQMIRLAASGAVAYKDRVRGEPGTWEVPGLPGPGVEQGKSSQATMGTSRSAYGQGFRPNLYYARPEASFWPGAGMPVSVRSDNLMPVPATDPRGIPARLSMPVVQRGSMQVQSVRALSTWPDWRDRR